VLSCAALAGRGGLAGALRATLGTAHVGHSKRRDGATVESPANFQALATLELGQRPYRARAEPAVWMKVQRSLEKIRSLNSRKNSESSEESSRQDRPGTRSLSSPRGTRAGRCVMTEAREDELPPPAPACRAHEH
jgi:hypothetical protein